MEFTKNDVAKLVGLSARNIQYWADLGLIVPDVSPKSGRGKALIFSRNNLIEIEVAKLLQKCGLSLQMIVSMLQSVRNNRDCEVGVTDTVFTFDLCDKDAWSMYGAKPIDGDMVVFVGDISLGTGCILLTRVFSRAKEIVDGYLGT